MILIYKNLIVYQKIFQILWTVAGNYKFKSQAIKQTKESESKRELL